MNPLCRRRFIWQIENLKLKPIVKALLSSVGTSAPVTPTTKPLRECSMSLLGTRTTCISTLHMAPSFAVGIPAKEGANPRWVPLIQLFQGFAGTPTATVYTVYKDGAIAINGARTIYIGTIANDWKGQKAELRGDIAATEDDTLEQGGTNK